MPAINLYIVKVIHIWFVCAIKIFEIFELRFVNRVGRRGDFRLLEDLSVLVNSDILLGCKATNSTSFSQISIYNNLRFKYFKEQIWFVYWTLII